MIAPMVMTILDVLIEIEIEIMDIIELEIEDKIIEVTSVVDLTTKLMAEDIIIANTRIRDPWSIKTKMEVQRVTTTSEIDALTI